MSIIQRETEGKGRRGGEVSEVEAIVNKVKVVDANVDESLSTI